MQSTGKLEKPKVLSKKCEVQPPFWHAVQPETGPASSLPHDVSDGENWVKIANYSKYKENIASYRAKMPQELLYDLPEDIANARALIHFNYSTTVPEYVNWFLLNVNCCWDATPDLHNRRFSVHDKTYQSPIYGKVTKRAGKVYIPRLNSVPSAPPEPVTRSIKMWAHLAYEDNLFKWLENVVGGVKTVDAVNKAMDIVTGEVAKSGINIKPQDLRKLARVKRFAKPLLRGLKYIKYAGWAAKGVELILGGRLITGYLVMSDAKDPGWHYAWDVDMILKGMDVFSDSSGEFTTQNDNYTIRLPVFDPSRQWKQKYLSATMTGGSFSMSVLKAFRRNPNSSNIEDQAFAQDAYVQPLPGLLDWTLKMKPNHSLGGGIGFYKSLPFLEAQITNGRKVHFAEVISPLL